MIIKRYDTRGGVLSKNTFGDSTVGQKRNDKKTSETLFFYSLHFLERYTKVPCFSSNFVRETIYTCSTGIKFD